MIVPMVRVKQGALKGAVLKNVDGGQYIAFRGIPYAEPPVGALRFQDPQPLLPWTGIRDAKQDGGSCAQFDMLKGKFVGGDDCLYLNVATNSLSGKRPVMVWIHGGGFFMGSSDSEMYSPDHLVKKDVVYVAINYRLGCFGFLNLDHKVAPGNQGLKDQVAALQWVRNNIETFGGDPDNVTIFGESAGAVSVHYLILSPLAKGLFHKAICQSGVANNPWAHCHEDIEYDKKMGFALAAAFGLETTDPRQVVDFLRTISPEKIVEETMKLKATTKDSSARFLFGPSIDVKSSEPFLPVLPMDLIDRGAEVPLIIGHNSEEGIFILAMKGSEDINTTAQATIDKMIAQALRIKKPETATEIVKEVKEFYFKGKDIMPNQLDSYVQLIGDLYFVKDIHQLADLLSKKKRSPTYLYSFSYRPNYPTLGKLFCKVDVEGTCHTDELGCLFHGANCFGSKSLEPGSRDRLAMERLTRMWTDFAKTGNPTPKTDDLIPNKWLPVKPFAKNYLEIGEELVPGLDPSKEKWNFWKHICAKI